MLLFYLLFLFFFFFNDTATTEIYTLSLHDALPILIELDREGRLLNKRPTDRADSSTPRTRRGLPLLDRKSTRLNSSHLVISYAVFCLKKKKKNQAHVIARRHIAQSATAQSTLSIAS